ncbi:MAG: stage II sporulation protein M [Candidatus Nanohaloarchaea archaeon]
MLPELIYREERMQDYSLLMVLGAISGLAGFILASHFYPSQSDILAVVFASIPLIYPLTEFFLEDEKRGKPHLPEVKVYGSLFIGEVFAFFALGHAFPEAFQLQYSTITAISGAATSLGPFFSILVNNLIVFAAILLLSAVIGSAGAFVLTWNASVLGVFFAKMARSIESGSGFLTCTPNPSPLCYLPHATLEMTGFIVAGISGSLVSAAVYREHFDRETWKDYTKLVTLGVLLIVAGALLESA